jgi:MFS family permease
VFFFTAPYLAEVAGYSGYRIALVFLPMTALMTVTSLLAGRWTTAAGTRWSVFAGCILFGAGLLLTAVTINPNPGFPQLAAALALTGIGVASTVVPITSSVLSVVPPERSGMAASAANTSREVGAVVGVAVLGALVNSQLHADLAARLRHLGIPANFQSIVIKAIETDWILKSDGGVDNFGAPWYGSLRGAIPAGQTVTGLAASPVSGGYWILTSNGGVHNYGAPWYGSAAGTLTGGVTAAGLAADTVSGGYLILKFNGGVANYHAPWYGSLTGQLPSGQSVTAIAGQ